MTNVILNSVLFKATANLPEGSIISFDAELIKGMLPQIVNLIVLTVILIFVLYKPVRNFLDNRTETIEGRIDDAKQKQNEAEELKKQYEELLRDIELEREKILSNANKKALERSDHILMQAKEEAESLYRHTISELEEDRKNAESEMKRQLIELSTQMANKFVSVSMDQETQDKYIEEALGDWEEGLWLS